LTKSANAACAGANSPLRKVAKRGFEVAFFVRGSTENSCPSTVTLTGSNRRSRSSTPVTRSFWRCCMSLKRPGRLLLLSA
jgi:hypothetical protein